MRLPALCASLALLLAGCAGVPPPTPAQPEPVLFHDAAYAPAADRIDSDDIFALSPAMQSLLDRASSSARQQPAEPRRQLIDLLYDGRRLALEYDASVTRNAAETFDARAGNCLSLLIMTAAFAKAAGLPVDYRSVHVDDAWSRDGDIYFASGHVNLVLEVPAGATRLNRALDGPLIVDFLPADALHGRVSHPIAEPTVVAMFMNNRAAEALARGRIDDAYWWARSAVRHDAAFLPAVNTLGVVYSRSAHPAWASAAFEHVLRREPANAKAMANLVASLAAEGRTEASQALAQHLAAIEPYPPFHFFNAGLAAMQAGDFRAARALFDRETQRQAYNPEVHYWLARANAALGDMQQAQRHLTLALQNSATAREHALYAAKLEQLRATR